MFHLGADERAHGLPWPAPFRTVSIGQPAGTSPAHCACRTRPGARRTANLATFRRAGAALWRVRRPKACMAARRTRPSTRPHRRRRPAPTHPCIPHAPKTLRNRALPIFGEVPADCTNPKMSGFWPAKMGISRHSLLLVNSNTKKNRPQEGMCPINIERAGKSSPN